MKLAFADNSGRLFGREPDLAYLLERSGHGGVTAVTGRAQIGKSWLLMELARRLSLEKGAAVPQVIGLPPPLVGYAESLGETADLLLRVVVDLYSRWLSDSSYWAQAQVVHSTTEDGSYREEWRGGGRSAGEAFEAGGQAGRSGRRGGEECF